MNTNKNIEKNLLKIVISFILIILLGLGVIYLKANANVIIGEYYWSTLRDVSTNDDLKTTFSGGIYTSLEKVKDEGRLNEDDQDECYANTVLKTYNGVYCIWKTKILFDCHTGLDYLQNDTLGTLLLCTDQFDMSPSYDIQVLGEYSYHDDIEHGWAHVSSDANSIRYSNQVWKQEGADITNFSAPGASARTFILAYAATFNFETKGTYGDLTIQNIAWWVANGTANYDPRGWDIYKAGNSVDEYAEQLVEYGSEPKVSPVTYSDIITSTYNGTANQQGYYHESCGTILDGSSYIIGPFYMSNYALVYSQYAAEFSGQGIEEPNLVGGICEGKLNFDGGDIDFKDVEILYYNKGAERVGDSYCWYYPSDTEYKYPLPQSTFYIKIDSSKVSNSTTLLGMTFRFRSTCSGGSGFINVGMCVYSYWSHTEPVNDTGESYSCTSCYHTGISYYYRSDAGYSHVYWCGGSGYCSHGNYGGCSDWDEEENGYEDCSYCSHGYYDGHHTGTYCGGTTYCSHGHTTCQNITWILDDYNADYMQSLLGITEAYTIVSSHEFSSNFNVRLTTKVSIKKFIYNVDHTNENLVKNSGLDTSFAENYVRREYEDSYKLANPVYVEYGDKVFYYIEIKNESSEGTRVKMCDYLPDINTLSSEGISIEKFKFTSKGPGKAASTEENERWFDNFYTNGATDASLLSDDSWIEVNANSTTTIEVTLLVNNHQKDLLGVNTAKLITRNTLEKKDYATHSGWGYSNSEDVDYCRRMSGSGKCVNGPVVNLAEVAGVKNIESSDAYKLEDYNVSINKYLCEYDEKVLKENNAGGYTNETVIGSKLDSDAKLRKDYSENDKKSYPLSVEKTETIKYKIDIRNDATAEGDKYATQVRPAEIWDYLQEGLAYESITAQLLDDDGNTVGTKMTINASISSGIATTMPDTGNNGKLYKITIGNDVILNPGQHLVFTIKVRVEESNMYLYSLQNQAMIKTLTNINYRASDTRYVVRKIDANGNVVSENGRPWNENITESKGGKEISSDYVRMKDLVISGFVWVDLDRDGLMNDSVAEYIAGQDGTNTDGPLYTDSTLKSTYHINDSAMKEGVVVKLYLKGNSDPIRTTKTDDKGFYTFARDENLNYYVSNYTYYNGGNVNESRYMPNYTYQRIDKANNKDTNTGNYTGASKLLEYYIEYEYDGVIYKSTIYAGMDNLNLDNGAYKSGDKYLIDSNAAEFTNKRETFNATYENISYNDASGSTLTYTKNGHISILDEYNITANDSTRKMTSRSFITTFDLETVKNAMKKVSGCGAGKFKSCSNHWKYWQILEQAGVIDASSYTNDVAGREAAKAYVASEISSIELDGSQTNYLWLFKLNQSRDYTIPETEYLKHITFGLEFRENVDLSLTKDVYQVKTTIKGDELEYNYNFNGDTNGVLDKENNYILSLDNYKKNYTFEIRSADYAYRLSEYTAQAVKDYLTEESELNIEVTYRITVTNNAVHDDANSYVKNDTDEKLNVKVSEIADLYDENFVKAQVDGTTKTANTVPVKVKSESNSNVLVTKNINVAEAWYFAEGNDTTDGDLYVIDTKASAAKPIYVKLTADNTATYGSATRYHKVYLNLNDESKYSKINGKGASGNVSSSGYNALYITGMDNLTLSEGSSFDIYVKYVLDKDNENVKVENESFVDTTVEQVRPASTTEFMKLSDDYTLVYGYSTDLGETITNTKVSLKRSLEVLDKIVKDSKTARGIENIAQIDGYSVYYENGNPTSLVDMDSNVGNYAIDDKGNLCSPDEIDYYEDTIYKTGINIGSEILDDWDAPETTTGGSEGEGEIVITPIRKINGTVWDDSRSVESEKQYMGNGFNANDSVLKDPETGEIIPKINDVVTYDYKDPTVIEDTDIAVRNAEVQFVEIVEVPVDSAGNIITDGSEPAEMHYFEQVRHNVLSSQVQHVRTDTNGKYELSGMIPGNYIVRFTYGDTVGNVCPKCNGAKTITLAAGTTGDNTCPLCNGKGYTTLCATCLGYGQIEDASGNIVKCPTCSKDKDGKELEKKGTGISTESINDQAREDMLIFNGQDYKSTKYTLGDILSDTETDNDTIVQALEKETLNDARDDEVSRLETNSYSELMNNSKAETLKGLANGNSYIINNTAGAANDVQAHTEKNNGLELENLTDNTVMNAETVEFEIKTEKLTETQMEDYIRNKDEFLYDGLLQMHNKTYLERNYIISNVDFGIEYRPENEVHLAKEIDSIKLTSNDNDTVLLDLKFESVTDSSGNVTHKIIEEESIGYDTTQFISNTYDKYDNTDMNKELTQGLVYAQVDQDLLQGTTLEITYNFVAENDSEIDRISKNLNAIRYQDNVLTNELVTEYKSLGVESKENYEANDFAAQMTYVDLYKKGTDSASKDANQRIDSRYDMTLTNPDYRIAKKTVTTDGDNNFYGKYVGYTYYTGNTNNNFDTVASLKFQTILDYVDTGLEFERNENAAANDFLNEDWSIREWETLVNVVEGLNTTRSLEVKKYFEKKANQEVGSLVDFGDFVVDKDNDVRYTTDPDGYYYSSLVTTNDTRQVDMMEYTSESISNDSLSRFLIPKDADTGLYALTYQEAKEVGAGTIKTEILATNNKTLTDEQTTEFVTLGTFEGKFDADTVNYIKESRKQSSAVISLPLSKVISSETDTEDMTYENFAEVVEFVTLTGRRTNYKTTIGNANVNPVNYYESSSGSVEYMVAALEPDAAATETVTFTVPTGLMLNRQKVISALETTNTVIIPVVAIVVAVMIVIGIIYVGIIRRRKYIK